MSIALIIVGGLVVISVVAIVGDIVGAAIKAKAKTAEALPPAELEELRSRLKALEGRLDERDQSVRRLEDELRFVTRMLEDKSGGR